MSTGDQNTTAIDYSKPHAFELEIGRITRVCKCGFPLGAEIHACMPSLPAPYTKHRNSCLIKADAY
jgi:hypothetical protein